MSEEPQKKKSLEEIFNIEPSDRQPSADLTTVEQPEVVEGVIEQIQDELEQDFQDSRDKLKDIAEIASTALQDLAIIAKDSEQARSYDALSKLIAAAVQTNKARVEIHKNRIDGQEGEGSGGPTTVNNNLYMTTAEFQKRLEQMNDGKESTEE